MTLKLSTGLRDQMLASGSLKAALTGGKIIIYGGSIPPTADSAQSAAILCRIKANGGAGLNFNANSVGGVLSKDASQTWSGVNALGGTATHYRFVANADTGAASTTEVRIQGEIGVIGKDLNFSSVTLTAGATQNIDYYVLSLPE